MHISHAVQRVQRLAGLGYVEACSLLAEGLGGLLLHQGEEVAARVVLHHEVQVRGVLESVLQLGDPVGHGHCHDVPLLLKERNLFF